MKPHSIRSPATSFVTRSLSGWGRFPVEPCHLFRPERRADIAEILRSGLEASYIPSGLGRSYGDAALNRDRGVICLTRLNRFLSFDAATGVLECEAGASLDEILRTFVPRGFFLPVTPGTRFVTLGGAIASDIHGKNHHKDGTLANFILDFRLLAGTGEVLLCSRAANPDVFWATVGGMGLTGVILSARLRMLRIESAYLAVDYKRTADLDEALALMSESDERFQYSVAWIDCLRRGKSLGRAVLMRGDHAKASDLPARFRRGLSAPADGCFSIPFDFPASALNQYTVGLFNAIYYRLRRRAGHRLVGLGEFFYPLDSIAHWNRMYGKRGFVQYQVALPLKTAREALTAILEKLAKSRRAAFLGVLKQLGEANPGLLSFPLKGFTLALDLPVGDGLLPLLRQLDKLVIAHGGRVYLAKDAVLEPDDFRAMYPKLGEFQAVKRKLDPEALLSSSLARRVGLA